MLRQENLLKFLLTFTGQRNTPTTKSAERYRKTPMGTSSTQKPKETLSGYVTKESIQGEGTLEGGPKDLISEEI